MPKYIFTYRMTYEAAASPVRAQADKGFAPVAEAMAAWAAFFEAIGPAVIDPGQPVFERSSLGEVGPSTVLGGYSIVDAADLDAAVARLRSARRFTKEVASKLACSPTLGPTTRRETAPSRFRGLSDCRSSPV